MVNEIECPECRGKSINYITGKCSKCGYTLDVPPQRVFEQHENEIEIPYQLQKLSLKKDDILVITPEKPFTSLEAKNLIDLFQSSTDIPFYIVFMNENIKVENLDDEKLKSIGLKRLEETKDNDPLKRIVK